MKYPAGPLSSEEWLITRFILWYAAIHEIRFPLHDAISLALDFLHPSPTDPLEDRAKELIRIRKRLERRERRREGRR